MENPDASPLPRVPLVELVIAVKIAQDERVIWIRLDRLDIPPPERAGEIEKKDEDKPKIASTDGIFLLMPHLLSSSSLITAKVTCDPQWTFETIPQTCHQKQEKRKHKLLSMARTRSRRRRRQLPEWTMTGKSKGKETTKEFVHGSARGYPKISTWARCKKVVRSA